MAQHAVSGMALPPPLLLPLTVEFHDPCHQLKPTAVTCMLSGLSSAAGDWLQGPYVYALYQHYGFERGDIGRLFIAGFGSSMVFGTFIGAMADKG